MAEPTLPAMMPADGASYHVIGLRCWAQPDQPPPGVEPFWNSCGAEPAPDLGLCAHHLAAMFPPEVRAHAPRP